jgi:hypothetical protein
MNNGGVMSKSLGIYVTSNGHMEKLIKLCRAAKKKDVEVTLFFTHIGILLCKDPRFEELAGLAKVALCNVGFEAQKLERPVAGLDEKAYSSQSFHAEMIRECDQYLSF